MNEAHKAPGGRRAGKGKSHDPSQYRALVRETKKARNGKEIMNLVRRAKRLNDPYYTSLALISISSHPILPLDEATSLAEQAMLYEGREERGWRKTELLGKLATKLSKWRDEEREEATIDVKGYLFDRLLEEINVIPVGKARSDAIKVVGPKVPLDRMEIVMKISRDNPGFVLEDGRAVIRSWIEKLKHTATAADEMEVQITCIGTLISGVDEPQVRAKLYGYLHLQMVKAGIGIKGMDPFDAGLKVARDMMTGEQRLEVLRYLVSLEDDEARLLVVKGESERFENPVFGIRLLSTLAGRADKIGQPELTHEWLHEAERQAGGIEDPKERGTIRLNLAQGFARSNHMMEAEDSLKRALEDCEGIRNEGLKAATELRVRSTGRRWGLTGAEWTEGDVAKEGEKKEETVPMKECPPEVGKLIRGVEGANHVLALYDAYEGGVKPSHLRAIARAAPLCTAFDLDLSLIGFPSSDLSQMVDATIRETNIGQGGKLLRKLVDQGRVSLVPANPEDDPEAWRRLGTLVATTSHPDEKKRVELEKLFEEKSVGAVHGVMGGPRGMETGVGDGEKTGGTDSGERICMIMGLGRKGLPASLLKRVSFHLELTGRNVALETCTVMGIIAERLRVARKK